MSKSIFRKLLSSILLLILVTGCTGLSSTGLPQAQLAVTLGVTPTPLPTLNVSNSIAVTPYYDSNGPQINVGQYSERLGIMDLESMTTLAEEMAGQKPVLTPQEMYVLAIRLYDLGDKDAAVYWYYEAQFRAKLFQLAIEPQQMVRVGEPTYELTTAYTSFQKVAGDFINGYAGCDLENWIRITTIVMNDNPNPPELDQMFPEVVFVDREHWQEINNNVATGLAVLINYIAENGELIKQQRTQQNLDRYCK